MTYDNLNDPHWPTTITTMDQQTHFSNDSPQDWPTPTHHHEPTHPNDDLNEPIGESEEKKGFGSVWFNWEGGVGMKKKKFV